MDMLLIISGAILIGLRQKFLGVLFMIMGILLFTITFLLTYGIYAHA